jgi:hypothetical protein
MARKEHDCRQRELNHAQEMAILCADKKVAVANAKLKAIEEALREEDHIEKVSIPEIPEERVEQRTNEWVNSVTSQEHDLLKPNPSTRMEEYPSQDTHRNVSDATDITVHSTPQAPKHTTIGQDRATPKNGRDSPSQHPSQQVHVIVPGASQIDTTGSEIIESLVSANKQIVAGLARQNLPKCHPKLQEFADLCADVECQIDNLPGLVCLNYPGAIRPIMEKLPMSLRTKWEKEVVKYAESHHDAYPSSSVFTQVVKSRSKIKNHPNILAGCFRKQNVEIYKERSKDRRALKTDVSQEKGNH